MTTQQDLIEGYLATWNEQDAARRSTLARQVFTDDVRYVDPLVVADGREAIVATIGAVQKQFPGWTFRMLDAVGAHHELTRFRWALSPQGTDDPDQAPVIGFDVAETGADGRIRRVHGFLDKVPAAAES